MDYKLFEIRYMMNHPNVCNNGVGYEVAKNWEEARELFNPVIESMKRKSPLLGPGELEIKIVEIRELDISYLGWKIKLEKLEY